MFSNHQCAFDTILMESIAPVGATEKSPSAAIYFRAPSLGRDGVFLEGRMVTYEPAQNFGWIDGFRIVERQEDSLWRIVVLQATEIVSY